jgi:hypothetical protein
VPSISQFRLVTPAPDAPALSAIPQFDAVALSATSQFDIEFYAPAPAPDAAALSATSQFDAEFYVPAPAPDAAALSAAPQSDVDAPRYTLHALVLESVMPSTISRGGRSSLQMPTCASCVSRRFLAWLNSSNV